MKLKSKSIKIIMIFCEKKVIIIFFNGPILTVSKYTQTFGIYYTKEDLPHYRWPELVTHWYDPAHVLCTRVKQ